MKKLNKNFNDQRHLFHLVNSSPWPFLGSLGAFAMIFSGVMFMHNYFGGFKFFLIVLFTICFYFYGIFVIIILINSGFYLYSYILKIKSFFFKKKQTFYKNILETELIALSFAQFVLVLAILEGGFIGYYFTIMHSVYWFFLILPAFMLHRITYLLKDSLFLCCIMLFCFILTVNGITVGFEIPVILALQFYVIWFRNDILLPKLARLNIVILLFQSALSLISFYYIPEHNFSLFKLWWESFFYILEHPIFEHAPAACVEP